MTVQAEINWNGLQTTSRQRAIILDHRLGAASIRAPSHRYTVYSGRWYTGVYIHTQHRSKPTTGIKDVDSAHSSTSLIRLF